MTHGLNRLVVIPLFQLAERVMSTWAERDVRAERVTRAEKVAVSSIKL